MTVVEAAQSEYDRKRLVFAILIGGTITSLALGTRATYGLFLDPVIETIGTGRAPFSLAIAVQAIVWGAAQPVAGAVADRFGTARVLAAGGVLFAGALLLMSTATASGMVMLSAGFLAGLAIASASFAVVLSAVGRMAPPGRRSLALGVVSAAGSIGQFVLIPVTQGLIDRAGWQTAAVALGLGSLAIVVLSPGLRGRAVDQQSAAETAAGRPLKADLRRAASSRSYWLLNLGFLVCGFHVTFIGTHLPSYVGEINVPKAAATTALSLIGLFNVFGSLLAGWLGDRFHKAKLLAGLYGLRAVSIAAFVLAPSSTLNTVLFGAAIGTLWLSTVPLTSGLVNQMFGTTNAGALFGIVFFSHQVGAFVGAWSGGYFSDHTGSYAPVWWAAVGLGVMATIANLGVDDGPVPDPPDRVGARLVPGGAAATVMIAVGMTAAVSTAAAADTDDSFVVPSYVCGIVGHGTGDP
ncbi:MAG: MFS transporter [Acidimicrobiales bacterium]